MIEDEKIIELFFGHSEQSKSWICNTGKSVTGYHTTGISGLFFLPRCDNFVTKQQMRHNK